MSLATEGASGPHPRAHPEESGSLELIREKERELTELIAAVRREAEETVAAAQARVDQLLASAVSEAKAEAGRFLSEELVAVDSESERILERREVEAETVRRMASGRLAGAAELVMRWVVPETSREGGR